MSQTLLVNCEPAPKKSHGIMGFDPLYPLAPQTLESTYDYQNCMCLHLRFSTDPIYEKTIIETHICKSRVFQDRYAQT